VGFGPRLAGFTRKGVEYRLSLFPLGGYLKPGVKTEEEWSAIPLARRVAFTLGGIIANGAAAVLLLTVYGVSSRDMGIFSALLWAGKQAAVILLSIFASLPLLFTNSGDLAGIIGIVAQGSAIIGGGQAAVLLFAAILSLILAAINYCLAVLDGGRALFDMLEKWPLRLAKHPQDFRCRMDRPRRSHHFGNQRSRPVSRLKKNTARHKGKVKHHERKQIGPRQSQIKNPRIHRVDPDRLADRRLHYFLRHPGV
jgi:membrane-associated protease RseP (regulator of RpoE activity)